MRITILTTGSRGDIQPFLALGQGLKQAEYQVKLATHNTFQEMAQEYELAFAAIAGDVQALMASEAGQNMLKSQNPILLIKQYAQMVQPLVAQAISDSWVACQNSDAIIFTATAVWGYDIAEALGIPCFFASLMPQSSNPDFPYPSLPPTLHLGRTLNRLSYPLLMEGFGLIFRQPLNEFRRSQLHLPSIPLGTIYRRLDHLPTPALYGYSPSVVPQPANWSDRIQMTGYWFLDQASDWQPSPALLDFLAAGSPPVYVGFGSMSGEDSVQFTQIILDALQQTGQRGILLTGWGGIAQTELPDDVFLLSSVPHDWLFPQMAAIVHHGGAGTTAAALRAGVPSVVVPFFGDQPFWGDRVMKLGTSPSPIPKAELTADRLAAAITTAVTNPVMQQQAKAIGVAIRAENGVQEAIGAIERYLVHSKYQSAQYV
ncbi:glycosyltransferase [Trichocoleus sp. FACHB-262]|uniref:glycosyltransferase n=1 Tax=Trichocoleus sp. FACHB-262 TaxID=2692869 RepID=UPI0016888C43|nr:glycosyltransferase [Trichocoleus sp. FACHB-262]MBD2121002.1 glycosyltransferase family 1 protein [Trichocoleus sp. FACHB-262]